MNTLALGKSVSLSKVLVATDFSEASNSALTCAASIAGANDAELLLVHALSEEAGLPVPMEHLPAVMDCELRNARQQLAKIESDSLAGVRHETILERGPVADVLEEVIRRKGIDLLVTGTHGRAGIKKLMLGSTAEKLFRRASCPVLTVGPSAKVTHEIRRVLYATDFGAASIHALPYAIEFANKPSGALALLHLTSPVPVEYMGPFWYPTNDILETEEAEKQRSLKKLRDLLPSGSGLSCSVEHVVELHFPPAGITGFARRWGADLIVMGVRHSAANLPRLVSHMPWAVAYEVVRAAECPVLTVRS